MRPHGRAFVSTTNPDAFAICDRCGFLYNRRSGLRFQWDYRGGQMVNTRLLVCWSCHDKPFMLNKPLQLPPDPEPVMDARPENMIAVDD